MQFLSEILKAQAGVTEENCQEAQRIKKEKGGSLGDILVRKKIITEDQLLEALSRLYRLPLWDQLPLNQNESDIIRDVPIQFLKKYFMVPLELDTNGDGLKKADLKQQPVISFSELQLLGYSFMLMQVDLKIFLIQLISSRGIDIFHHQIPKRILDIGDITLQ